MNSAMLNYDDFDLETATEDRLTLREAVKKAGEIRSAEPDTFVRIKNVDSDEFIIVKIPAKEVYAEWADRIQRRLSRMMRKRASR
jgi:hypothetical protein